MSKQKITEFNVLTNIQNSLYKDFVVLFINVRINSSMLYAKFHGSLFLGSGEDFLRVFTI